MTQRQVSVSVSLALIKEIAVFPHVPLSIILLLESITTVAAAVHA